MTRKKSRPTHRENAAAVPSNEGGFYKMFWNSMDTNPGTNGPNSPSQGEVHATSPPVIIIDDSPADSPCVHDENSCENLVIPQPIKEETCEDPAENANQPSAKANSENAQESHPEINGDCSPHSTCPPGNPMTSHSKNNSPSPSLGTNLISLKNPPQTSYCENFATSPNDTSTEVCIPLNQPQEAPSLAGDGGDQLVEDFQVRDQLTPEEHFEVYNSRQVVRSYDSENISNTVVISNQPLNVIANSTDTTVSNGAITEGTPICIQEQVASVSEASSVVVISAGMSGGTPTEMLEETPMDVALEPHSPAVSLSNYEENTQEPPGNDILDPQCSSVGNEETVEPPPMNEISNPPSPALSDSVGRTLNLLQSLLNAPDEDLEDFNEAFSELPALIGQHQYVSEQNEQNEEDMVEFESTQESSIPSNVEVSNVDADQGTSEPQNMVCRDENRDGACQNQTDVMVVDNEEEEEEAFPTFSNFIPKKIKVDSIGILRSVKLLKDSVRALYKEYLKSDVILRTVNTSETPIEESNESTDEVQETLTSPPVKVYPICCVKMERLPDPFVEKSTVTMSDDTFKTWKRQIIQQRNEEKFRHLKVWRRGRTLLWRECELAGMDRATYDEQVAYVKKHRLSENSSSDNDSSGDESGSDDSSHHHYASEESDKEHGDIELSYLSSYEASPEMKQKTSISQSVSLPPVESQTSASIVLPENEYTVVDRASTNQSSSTNAPSALKITIRKTSMSKEKEDDKEKPTDEEENFPVPAKPIKSRKVATKRTFRRPSEPLPKANIPPKLTTADTKKSKSASVDNEDLYDQSLLGRRSYEVENFNLLEKWDIPFEAPTLFRSPRAASRLAQLKTKEAFAPVLKRNAPPKIPSSAATTAVSANTVYKEVKEVVEWLCSKTVEAMLFPGFEPAGTEKFAETDEVKSMDSNTRKQPTELPSKSLILSEETSSTLDESSEMSQSETNSTLDASSDFGGSTASLASVDFVPPKDKSPQKPRRRRRIGPTWCKKKKAKGKAAEEQPGVEEAFERKGILAKNTINSPSHVTEQPAEEQSIQDKTIEKVCDSPAHSTQVPVVSEGPGQSPHESEDDLAHRIKHPIHQPETNQTVDELTVKKQPNVVARDCEMPSEQSQPHKKAKEGVIQPRLTRSKQPTVELDPGLLENFGVRKRRTRSGAVDDVSQDEGAKKQKHDVAKTNQQKDKPESNWVVSKISEGLDSTTGDVNYNSNTQVPEVSEGPGEVELDHEDRENKGETGQPPARMLRSRFRGPRPTKSTAAAVKDSSEQKPDEAVRVIEEEQADKTDSEEPLVLESPKSPSPEPAEPEPDSRMTRSKKRRSGPAYVAVKSTDAGSLPSVCDVVDSIACHRLPLNQLFDNCTSEARLLAEPVIVCRLQTLNCSDTTLIPTSTSSEQRPTNVQNESHVGESIQPPAAFEGTSLTSKLNQKTSLLDSDSCIEPLAKETSVKVSGQSRAFPSESPGGDIDCLPAEKDQPAAVHSGTATAAVENDIQRSADSGRVAVGSSSGGSLALGKPFTENGGNGKLEVLDTLNTILAVDSPAKVCHPLSAASTSLPPPLSGGSLPISSMLTPSAVSSTSLPTFPTSAQDITSILPGTFLSSLLSSTLDANLTTYNNVIAGSTTLTDDPDGDLVIDEGEAPESDTRIDVNFWENLTNADLSDTNADFSDDDNNTDLADKINKIIKDQIHQDPVPVPSLKPKESSASSNEGNKQALGETSPSTNETDKTASALNRRDSIDERTGLPNNLIQRLRDPRIRSRLLSHLEEVETNDKTPQPTVVPNLNSLPSNSSSSIVGDPLAAITISSDPKKTSESVAAHSVGYPLNTADSSCPSSQVPAISSAVTHPIMGAQLRTISSGLAGQTTSSAIPNTPLVVPGTPSQLPLVAQGLPSVQPVQSSDKPEEPPDPSKVDFLVPPSDDEDEEESIKRRPSKKAKKEVDVELMYKSPLEDLQSEIRPTYGERAPRRYADNYMRRKSGDDRQPRWDDRSSRIDGPRDRRFEERGRSKSRERGFEDRGRSRSREPRFDGRGRSMSRDQRFDDRGRERSRSRDGRAFYDRPIRDQARDRRAYDPYPGREEHEIAPQHMDMQAPYSQLPWSVADPAFNHHQPMRHQLESTNWQQNYYQEPYVPPHPPIFMPEPPKIDYMETRLINLELLPKTTNLEVSPLKKVFSHFDKDSLQLFEIPKPQYDPNDQPHTIKMMDPVSEEMIDFIQTPRPTSGLTKKYFAHVPPSLSLDDVVKFHCISPAYVMVRDNEEDPSSSSDEEKDELDSKQKILLHHRKSALEHKKRLSKPVLEHHEKRELKLEHHSQKENERFPGNHPQQESSFVPGSAFESDPLQNILKNLPLLKEQYSLHASQPLLIPPPPPEWNDVDLRISRALAAGSEELKSSRSPSPAKQKSSMRSRSRSKSPYRSRRSRSPRRRRRSRSRSLSLRSDMSTSPSRSRSRSPSYSHRNSRRRRSRSRSSEQSWSRRSHSPKRHSTSISPSRKHSRR